VYVVYVSPVQLDSDTLDYYFKLLSINQENTDTRSGDDTPTKSQAVSLQSLNEVKQERLFSRERLHVVTPENLEAFKNCRMSLSTVLLYSPRCLARIKRLVAGKPSYIVSGLVSRDDIALAHALGMSSPMLFCVFLTLFPVPIPVLVVSSPVPSGLV